MSIYSQVKSYPVEHFTISKQVAVDTLKTGDIILFWNPKIETSIYTMSWRYNQQGLIYENLNQLYVLEVINGKFHKNLLESKFEPDSLISIRFLNKPLDAMRKAKLDYLVSNIYPHMKFLVKNKTMFLIKNTDQTHNIRRVNMLAGITTRILQDINLLEISHDEECKLDSLCYVDSYKFAQMKDKYNYIHTTYVVSSEI